MPCAVAGTVGVQAIRPANTEEAKHQALRYLPPARDGHDTLVSDPLRPAFLLDAAAPGQFGGSGQLADWDMARVLATRWPILLAGGLRPDNVAAAIAAVHPWGVDVASGVESGPGRKDPVSRCGRLSRRRSDDTATRRSCESTIGWIDT